MPDIEASTSVPPRVIKRYANRKLYDTRDSRYVTLPQIAELVRAGEDVQIIDNRTKENLTSVTLAQIIYEVEKSAEASARQGVKTLRDFIQVGGEKLMAHFREGPVGRLMPRAELPDIPELLDRKKTAMIAPAIEALEELQRRADQSMRAVLASVVAPLKELQIEIARLQNRIEELESKLTRERRPEKPATPATPTTGETPKSPQ
jgi:polyhydroxyalkanoate synthesis repressor PhaR